MTNVPANAFPTAGEIMELVRSIVNDTFPGIAGVQGRIFTNDAPFTLPYFNSALRKLQRRLRNEGVTFPIKDYYILENLPPVVEANTGVFVYVGFDGYSNGTQLYGNLRLPGDCMQVKVVRQRLTGSNLIFTPMVEAQEGLPSGFQNKWLGMWEWRQYRIYMNGSIQAQDIMLRYLTGQPPLAIQPDEFDATQIHILDCQDAVANLMAGMYGTARGANEAQLAKVAGDAEEAIEEMATEYVRRSQQVNYNRPSYGGGGSRSTGNTSLGTTGTVS